MEEIGKLVIEESKALVKPVYEDLAQPAAKEVGTVLGRSIHALLCPIRGLCWGFEKIEQAVVNGLEKRLEKTQTEKLHTPQPEIAVPLIQALTYTAQNDTLREMYLTLLAKSMNSDYDKIVHQSYVHIIEQMNRLDVLVFSKIHTENANKYVKAITPKISLKGQGKIFIDAMPQWFLGWIVENFDIFDVSACLTRLSRLGLVELMYDRTAGKDGYDKLKSSTLITSIYDEYVVEKSWLELELIATDNVLYINEFGSRFADACL